MPNYMKSCHSTRELSYGVTTISNKLEITYIHHYNKLAKYTCSYNHLHTECCVNYTKRLLPTIHL